MKKMPLRKIPLGRMVTIFCFVMLGVATILMLTDRSQAQDKPIEVLYSSDKTQELPRVKGRASVDPQTAAETQSELECEFASSTCKSTNQFNGAVAVLLQNATGWYEDGTKTEQGESQSTSLLNFLQQGIAVVFTPAASGVYYVADAADHVGIASPTYAQGFGYYGLSPFLNLWKVIRNFTYMIFAVIIIGVAISILLRQTFSGKGAVTIQQVLPNIIIALIVITFSYAIAGFMIDIMYWIMYAAGFFIQKHAGQGGEGVFSVAVGSVNDILGRSIFGVLGIVLTSGMQSAYDGVSGLVKSAFGDLTELGTISGWFSGSLAALIMIVVVIVSVFKLFLTLAKSYVYVIMYTVFSPVILAMQVFNPQTFRKWALSIAANLSPFVITFFMIIFLGVANAMAELETSGNSGWLPPFMLGKLGSTTDAGELTGVGAIVALGMILSMNEIIAEMKKKIGGSGGFFEQMASTAQDNAAKAWKGAPGKFGRSVGGSALRLGIPGAVGLAKTGGNMINKGLPALFTDKGTTITGAIKDMNVRGKTIGTRLQEYSNRRAEKREEKERLAKVNAANAEKRRRDLKAGKIPFKDQTWSERYANFSGLKSTTSTLFNRYADTARSYVDRSTSINTLPLIDEFTHTRWKRQADAFRAAENSPMGNDTYNAGTPYGLISGAEVSAAKAWLDSYGEDADAWRQANYQDFMNEGRRKKTK